MRKKLVYTLILLACWAVLPGMGQTMPDSVRQERFTLYYYCDRIDLDKEYLDNSYQIFRIKNILLNSKKIDSITIYSYASPEGSPARNKWLAEKRSITAKEFILASLPDSSTLKPENIRLRPMGENWEGLEAELEANYNLPNRDRVMRIIRADIPTETKKWRLKRLDNGYTYNWIIRHHMPRLRMATWICVHAPIPLLPLSFDDSDKLQLPQALQLINQTALTSLTERRTIMAIKSNLLYDALTLLNFSVEVPITKHFSALYYHQFPWWRWGEAKNEYCIRFLSIGAEARWWISPDKFAKKRFEHDKLTGHFLGIYAESGKWDFEWGRNICHQGEHWSAGLSYGYAMPIGKYLNLEFSVSAGYASIPYRRYIPSADYEILWKDPENHGRWHYFGPTKAQVTLAVPIMIKTKKKGGRQ